MNAINKTRKATSSYTCYNYNKERHIIKNDSKLKKIK